MVLRLLHFVIPVRSQYTSQGVKYMIMLRRETVLSVYTLCIVHDASCKAKSLKRYMNKNVVKCLSH